MRMVALALGVVISLQAASAFAAGVVTIRDVKSASAIMSPDGRTIVVSATVDLPDGCWTNPRVAAPEGSKADAEGAVEIKVVADSTAGPGMACPMIYRPNVPAQPLHWTGFPPGVKAVRLIGARSALVAPVTR